jgi:hypothetical protein
MAQATASYMAMLRGAIALAWEDNVLHAEEKERLQQIIQRNIIVSEAQRVQLLEDIAVRAELGDVWGEVSDMHDRAHLLNLALALCHEDGDYSELERSAYQKLSILHHKTLDGAALQAELRIMARISQEHAARERQEDYNAMNRIEKFLYIMDSLFSGDFAEAV